LADYLWILSTSTFLARKKFTRYHTNLEGVHSVTQETLFLPETISLTVLKNKQVNYQMRQCFIKKVGVISCEFFSG